MSIKYFKVFVLYFQFAQLWCVSPQFSPSTGFIFKLFPCLFYKLASSLPSHKLSQYSKFSNYLPWQIPLLNMLYKGRFTLSTANQYIRDLLGKIHAGYLKVEKCAIWLRNFPCAHASINLIVTEATCPFFLRSFQDSTMGCIFLCDRCDFSSETVRLIRKISLWHQASN